MHEMTPERWRRLRTILDRALELPPADRESWLRAGCGDDAALRADVERLLEAEARAGSLLDSPVGAYAGALVREIADGPPPQDPMLGRQLGAYRLIGQVARGGMGTVYLAERADGQFEQRVAVKVLQMGLDRGDLLRHFLAERQILAALSHPAIAHLLDGGATEEGRPYLVLEYVEGRPIDAYCDAHRLTIDERLRRFLRVAEAVQYAHRNLIVHRDLKPSNILVTDSGEVKLLDFGIAKLLEGDAAPASAAATSTGVRLMTPEYASPEQVRGEPITTASDVYQLGLLLYELLAGRRPYRVTGRSAAEAERLICEAEPTPPSRAALHPPELPGTARTERAEPPDTVGAGTAESAEDPVRAVAEARRTTPERLGKRLQGDLDAIVLQALRKEPQRRYGSVEALSEDIQRSLEGLPVRARGDTRLYRARRFARRHRWPLAAAAAFALLLAGYAVTVSVQSGRVRAALGQAQLETAKAQEVSEFVVGLFQAADPSEAQGDTITARELLERGRERADALAGQPEVQAQVLHVLGTVHLGLGAYEQARGLLQRALQLRTQVHGPLHADVAATQDRLGAALQEAGDYAAAEPHIREALATRRQLFGNHHADVSRSLNNLAVVLHFRGDYDGAEPIYREALALDIELLGEEHEDVATSLQNLGLILRDKGDLATAETLLRDALAMRQRLLGSDHPRVATSLNFLAGVLRRKGDAAGAESLFREVLALRRRVLGDDHPQIAQSLNNLAIVLGDQQRYGEAEPLLRESLALYRRLLGEDHPEVATGIQNLAWNLTRRGSYTEAEPLYRDALALRRRLLGDSHPDVAVTLTNLGDLLLRQNRAAAAEPVLREALAINGRTLPEDHWQQAATRTILGACLTSLGRYEEAGPHLTWSLSIFEQQFGANDPRTQRARDRLIAFQRASDSRE